jgi:tetratricopeptide (TPR) repeat protein
MSQTPPSVVELFRDYLRRQMTAQAAGLALADPDGQVVPHEAVPMQPADPRLAWENALAVVDHFATGASAPRWEVPPDWPSLVAAQEPAIALAFCIGNFPQMMRNLQPLLAGGDLAALRQSVGRPVSVSPALLHWANKMRGYPQLLLATGVLRLARRFDEASALLRSQRDAPKSWQALRANEEAALAWHRGQAEEALALWQAQKASVPVLFNRGMAALFLGRPTEAQTALSQAIAQLPDTSAWHHLGHLYLALAAARS